MIVWRITAARRAPSAFGGDGTLRYAGRWHKKGYRVVYTSATLALASVETFVNLTLESDSAALVAVSAEIPDGIKIVSVDAANLPENWAGHPGPPALQALGSDWLQSLESAVLAVPSAPIPVERNYLLNPAHPDFKKIKIRAPLPFGFDSRMWKRNPRRRP
jgi:RES domain-containing protein